MTSRHWFTALALGSIFLATWAQACGLRDNGQTFTDPVTRLEIKKCPTQFAWSGSKCVQGADYGNWKGWASWENLMKQYDLTSQTDWRPISIEEFRLLRSRAIGCGPKDGSFSGFTSSQVPGKSDKAYSVDLEKGSENESAKIAVGTAVLVRGALPSGSAAASSSNNTTSSSNSITNLDTPERLQAAQANQQQADRVFAGKKRVHDDNANSEQPIPGPSEGKTTNRGAVRVNVAYCFDSHKRAYSGSLKCSAQRFGYTSVEAGQTVELLPPSSGLQALTFACKHPAKPYDVEFVNDGLSGRCAAY